jgi:hypothetical protein
MRVFGERLASCWRVSCVFNACQNLGCHAGSALTFASAILMRVAQEAEDLGLDLSEHGESIGPGRPYKSPAAYDAKQIWDAANDSPTKTTRIVPLPVTYDTDTPRPIEPLARSGVLTVSNYD